MVSTIIFDLSEVYLGGMYGIEEKIANLINLSNPQEALYLQKETEEFFHGQITEDEFWNKLNNKFKWGLDVSVLKNLIRNQMNEIDGTRSIIEKLHEKGYKLGLLSIHAREWVDHLEEKFDYHKFFHSRLYSFEVALCKPEKKAFELMLEKLQVQPEDALFIDDYDVNTKAAAQLGIKTILFENASQLKKELGNVGIVI